MTEGVKWSPEEDDRLRALWPSTRALADILTEFPMRTKHALSGRAHRLQLPLRDHAMQWSPTAGRYVGAKRPRKAQRKAIAKRVRHSKRVSTLTPEKRARQEAGLLAAALLLDDEGPRPSIEEVCAETGLTKQQVWNAVAHHRALDREQQKALQR